MPYKVIKDSRCEAGKPYGVVKESDNQLMGCHVSEDDANNQLAALYANEPMVRGANERAMAPIEYRSAVVDNIDQQQRIVTLLAVPYEEPGPVMYRGQIWKEIFTRGAFDGIDKRPNRVKVTRDHDDKRVVGKAINFWPRDQKGLRSEVKISKTDLGDETLALAEDSVLDISIGYAAPADQEHTIFDRRAMTRRIKKAYLDHVSFVGIPTWDGATVLNVRSNNLAEKQELVSTPNIDMLDSDELLLWARELSEKIAQEKAQQGE